MKFIVDDISLSFLKGSTIDFEDSLIRQSFVVQIINCFSVSFIYTKLFCFILC